MVGASKYLANLPSRGLFSSNSGRTRVYIPDRDTSPPGCFPCGPEMDEDLPEVTILEENTANKKNKQPMVEYDVNFDNLINTLPQDFISSSVPVSSESGMSMKSQNPITDQAYSYLEDDTDSSDYDYEGDESEGSVENDYDNISAVFDQMCLPSGVEAAVPWLQISEHGKTVIKPELSDQVVRKPITFKQFDVVQDTSDHYYRKGPTGKGIAGEQSSLNWVQRIQHEWKILQNGLPETIFVQVYEERLDLLRASIVGPSRTPYHDGLFFFDVFFPSDYPSVPPLVHYHSGGLRLNPNLYHCGKVCLSLLGSWKGHGHENWIPGKSTMLQVLVSLQALVLNSKPYFNEPGFVDTAGTVLGERQSTLYNEQAFILSCRTMLYTLRRPPKNFENFVVEHFSNRGRAILVACCAYMNGAKVGCVDAYGIQDAEEGDSSSSPSFRQSLKELFEQLLMEFALKGGVDCIDFLTKHPEAKAKNEEPPSGYEMHLIF